MKSFSIVTLAVYAALQTGSSASPIEQLNNCNPNGNPDCLPGYNLAYSSAYFDNVAAQTSGTPMSTYGPLILTGWRVASAPVGQPHAFAPPHLTPESGNQYIRAKESSGAFNSTRISTSSSVFKFKSLFFGCSRYIDLTPIPCTLQISGFNPGGQAQTAASNVTIPYLYGSPGPNGEAPLQEVSAEDLAGLGVAHDFVLSTTGPAGTKPRLVLDNVNITAYNYSL